MKTQLTITELAQQIAERATKKADFVTDTRAMQMTGDGKQLIVAGSAPDGSNGSYNIGQICHEQLADRLEIPTKYYRRMLGTNPNLLATNVNSWFAKEPETRMIRTLGETARAFLSDKYQRLDDDFFAETTLSVIQEDPTAEVVSAAITEEKTYIKFVSRRTEREVSAGDPIQFGVSFTNSEVGRGRLQGALYMVQLRCLNGMTSQEDVWGTNHVGSKIKVELGEIFQLDTINADSRATMLKLRDFTRHILSPERCDAWINRMRALRDIKVDDPIKTVEKLAKTFTLGEQEKTSILTHLIRGGDLSGYGIQNAVTAAAQDDALTYERASELEQLGGKLITLPPTQWREIIKIEREKVAA
jgi:hypothetical protein